jgi:hypothetical protein
MEFIIEAGQYALSLAYSYCSHSELIVSWTIVRLASTMLRWMVWVSCMTHASKFADSWHWHHNTWRLLPPYVSPSPYLAKDGFQSRKLIVELSIGELASRSRELANYELATICEFAGITEINLATCSRCEGAVSVLLNARSAIIKRKGLFAIMNRSCRDRPQYLSDQICGIRWLSIAAPSIAFFWQQFVLLGASTYNYNERYNQT